MWRKKTKTNIIMYKKNTIKAKLAFFFSSFRNAFALPIIIDGIEITEEDIMNQLIYKKPIKLNEL